MRPSNATDADPATPQAHNDEVQALEQVGKCDKNIVAGNGKPLISVICPHLLFSRMAYLPPLLPSLLPT